MAVYSVTVVDLAENKWILKDLNCLCVLRDEKQLLCNVELQLDI